MHTLSDLGIVFLAALLVVLAVGRLGLPIIVGYLIAGLVVGPGGFGLVSDSESVAVLAELGVGVLLFTIGLEFSLDRIRRFGTAAAVAAAIQVGVVIVVAVGIAVALGHPARHGVFWGLLASTSSTAIVLRALRDRAETTAPHGRLVVGVQVFQDLLVIPMMLSLPLLAGGGAEPASAFYQIGRSIAFVIVVLLAARSAVPWALRRVVARRERELFLLGVLVILIGVAWTGHQIGLPLTLGAFLAGVMIADTEFVHQASSDVAPIRDGLASLFFVSIGMLFDPGVLVERLGAVIGLFALLVVGKMVIATLAALVVRMPARIALLAGGALAQVGEFSFVLLAAGQGHGIIGPDGARLFLAAAVLTMVCTPLLITAGPHLATLARLLAPIERALHRPEEPDDGPGGQIVIAGLGVGGHMLMNALDAVDVPYVGLDVDPNVVAAARREGRRVHWGDAASPEVLLHGAQVKRARLLVLTLSDSEAAIRAAAAARRLRPDLPILARVPRTDGDESELRHLGVEVVAQDVETAIEMAERVLVRTGIGGHLLGGVIAAMRGMRDEHGARAYDLDALLRSIGLEAVPIGQGNRLAGATLQDSGIRQNTGTVVVAVARREGVTTAPPPDFVLGVADVLFVAGTASQVARARAFILGEPA